MLTALIKNRVEFVKMFMENGVNMKDFLTMAKLSLMYNAVSQMTAWNTV